MLKHIDELDSLRLKKNNGVYERQETNLVKRLLKPDSVFVDVGAHIGYYTCMAAGIIDNTGNILSFEPYAENFKLLLKNFNELVKGKDRMYSYDDKVVNYIYNIPTNAGLINSAIGNGGKQHIPLYLNEKNTGDHRLFTTIDRDKVTVGVDELDRFFYCGEKIDLLKIDVQGYEYKVLCGGESIINMSNNINILLEYSPHLLKLAGDSPGKLIGWLLDHGFYIYQKYDGKWRYADHGFLNNKAKKFHTNLFCSRSKHEDIDWSE